MARSVQLAFLHEGALAASLEVLRRLIEPSSTSLPHLTLRHTSQLPRRFWALEDIPSREIPLVLEAATSFDNMTEPPISTLVIACNSEPLELLSYKPDFPTSYLHFTLYAGEPSYLASRALGILQQFPWKLRFHDSLDLFSSSREAASARQIETNSGLLLSAQAELLLSDLLDEIGSPAAYIPELDDSTRLEIVKLIAIRLHKLGEKLSGPSRGDPDLSNPATENLPSQQVFWSKEELSALTGSAPGNGRARQRLRGAIATPPELALDVAMAAEHFVAEDRMIDFGEPAAGNGILLAAARRAFGPDRLNSEQLIEMDDASAKLLRQKWSWNGTVVRNDDFLKMQPDRNSWTFILANPPYRRSQLIATELAQLRRSLAEELNLTISARADLFVYFILRAHSWLRSDGIAAWIIPSEFLVTHYGRTLREYLSRHVTLLRIHSYEPEDTLFDNAMTSTTAIIYRKSRPAMTNETVMSHGGSMMLPKKRERIPLKTLTSAERWSFQGLLHSDANSTAPSVRLGDIFDIRRGLATGANSWFVLSSQQAVDLRVPSKWIKPVIPRAREVEGGVISSDPLGRPLPFGDRWLIDANASLDAVRAEAPKFADYLASLRTAVGGRSLVARRPLPWLQEGARSAPLLFVYMAKGDSTRPRFLRNHSEGIHLNNYIGLYEKKRQTGVSPHFSLESIHQALMGVSPEHLRDAGRTYGRNLVKLEPRELASLRIQLENLG